MSPSPGSLPPACIVGRSTGVGLDRDAALIGELLKEKGLESVWKHPRSLPLLQRLPLPRVPKYSLAIHLERVFPAWRRSAVKSILIPNQERFPLRHLDRLSALDAVFCKTRHATEIFSRHHPAVHHLGFTSTDRHLPGSDPLRPLRAPAGGPGHPALRLPLRAADLGGCRP